MVSLELFKYLAGGKYDLYFDKKLTESKYFVCDIDKIKNGNYMHDIFAICSIAMILH